MHARIYTNTNAHTALLWAMQEVFVDTMGSAPKCQHKNTNTHTHTHTHTLTYTHTQCCCGQRQRCSWILWAVHQHTPSPKISNKHTHTHTRTHAALLRATPEVFVDTMGSAPTYLVARYFMGCRVYMFKCIHMYIYTYMCIHVYICTFTQICIHIYVFVPV